MTDQGVPKDTPPDQTWPADFVCRDGRYFLFCRTLGVSGEGDTPTSAHANLVTARQEALARYAKAGRPVPIPEERNTETAGQLAREALPFALKAAIAAVIAAVFIIWATSPISNALLAVRAGLQDTVAESIGSARNALSPEGIAATVRGMAATLQSMTPERRTEMRQGLRTIAAELAPYIAELQPLFDPSCACSPAESDTPSTPAR